MTRGATRVRFAKPNQFIRGSGATSLLSNIDEQAVGWAQCRFRRTAFRHTTGFAIDHYESNTLRIPCLHHQVDRGDLGVQDWTYRLIDCS